MKQYLSRVDRFSKHKEKSIKSVRNRQAHERVSEGSKMLSGINKQMEYPIKSKALKNKMK